jgi:hypothetical protein
MLKKQKKVKQFLCKVIDATTAWNQVFNLFYAFKIERDKITNRKKKKKKKREIEREEKNRLDQKIRVAKSWRERKNEEVPRNKHCKEFDLIMLVKVS